MFAARVIKVLPGRKNLYCLSANPIGQLKQARMQSLIQKQMGREDVQHFQQVPRARPAFTPDPPLLLLSHFCHKFLVDRYCAAWCSGRRRGKLAIADGDFRGSRCKLEIWKKEPQLASRATHVEERLMHESDQSKPVRTLVHERFRYGSDPVSIAVRVVGLTPRFLPCRSRQERKSWRVLFSITPLRARWRREFPYFWQKKQGAMGVGVAGGGRLGGTVSPFEPPSIGRHSPLIPGASKFLKSHSLRLPGSPERADIIGVAFPCVFQAVQGDTGAYRGAACTVSETQFFTGDMAPASH